LCRYDVVITQVLPLHEETSDLRGAVGAVEARLDAVEEHSAAADAAAGAAAAAAGVAAVGLALSTTLFCSQNTFN
jgi:hypothetical protein